MFDLLLPNTSTIYCKGNLSAVYQNFNKQIWKQALMQIVSYRYDRFDMSFIKMDVKVNK